jgi:hypothetical protein
MQLEGHASIPALLVILQLIRMLVLATNWLIHIVCMALSIESRTDSSVLIRDKRTKKGEKKVRL